MTCLTCSPVLEQGIHGLKESLQAKSSHSMVEQEKWSSNLAHVHTLSMLSEGKVPAQLVPI